MFSLIANNQPLKTVSTLVCLFLVALFSTGFSWPWGKKEKEVKIGVILELTGPLSRLGERSKRGMELAVEEINRSGGIRNRNVHLIIEDTKSDPKEGVSAFLKLVNTYHVPVVIGAIGSSTVMACAPIANKRGIVLFSSGATSPLITKAGDYIFRNRLSGESEVKAMAKFAIEELRVKKVAVLYVNTDYGVGNKNVFENVYSGLGGEVPLSEGFDQGETDFRSHLAKIKELSVEGVYIIAVGENGYILKQAKETSLNTHFLSTVGIEGPDVWEIADNAANGVIYTVQKFDLVSLEKAESFRKNYYQRYREEPDLFSALGYDGIYIVTKVIAEYGYKADMIKNGLYKLKNFQGVVGEITFDENGDVQSEVMMKMTKDGNFVPYRGGQK